MPLVKRGLVTSPQEGAAAQDSARRLATLGSADADARWNAARALAGRAEAVQALAEALGHEEVPRVREAIITGLLRVGNGDSVAALVPYLRASDAGLRNAAVEALQAMPQAIAPFLPALFRDDDSDVRILATELVREMAATEATRLLCDLLEREQHPNVCAAAIEVLAEVGTREALPVLAACARRFAESPFLPFAVSTAVARISDA